MQSADYDWQQKGYKEELVNAFLTTRLIGLRLVAFNSLEVLKAKSRFPRKRHVEKEVKGYTEVTKKNCLHVNLFIITNIISYYLLYTAQLICSIGLHSHWLAFS